MALHLYSNRESLPKDMKFIYDVEKFFMTTKLRNTEFTRKVLREVEKSSFVDEETFVISSIVICL